MVRLALSIDLVALVCSLVISVVTFIFGNVQCGILSGVLCVAFIINFICIGELLYKDESGDSWLGLYFKRKRAEERKKLEELEGSAKKDN